MTKDDAAFDLTYFTDQGARTERVYLRLIVPPRFQQVAWDEPITYQVVRHTNDVVISADDTEKDAITGAMIALHQWADFGADCPAMADTPSPMTGSPKYSVT